MAAVLQKHARTPRKSRVLTQPPELDETGKPKLPQRSYSNAIAKRPLATLPDAERAQIAQQVLERYIHGEEVADMAQDFNTSDVTIYALLLREHEGPWSDIQRARALARLERHTKGLKEARDPLSLARERELVRSAQWELERLLNRLYGQKQEVSVTVNTDLGDRLRRARERTVEPLDVVVLPSEPIVSQSNQSESQGDTPSVGLVPTTI